MSREQVKGKQASKDNEASMITTEESTTNVAPPTIALNDTVAIELPTLIETRAIIQANSGGGKSWAIRRILEQAYGKVQQMVIDVEGSFRSLREQLDYVLLGAETDDVDYPITPENAALLAMTLLEARTSAIIDLYEYRPAIRQQIVRLFLDALMNAPKTLWHDCLVVLDEAHVFCPKQGNAEAKEAVEALCSRGRARGFCAILATQRISKLDKDAVAECNNKLIGRTSLDLDRKRSNAELELPPKSRDLTSLAPGEFYVFGPAISPEVQKVTIGSVFTTHPQAGSRRLMSSPPPPESLCAVLGMLRSLPAPMKPEAPGLASSPVSGSQHPPRQIHALKYSASGTAVLAAKDAELQALRERVAALEGQIALLNSITVSVNGSPVPASDLPAVLKLDTLHTQVEQATITVANVGSETPIPAPTRPEPRAQPEPATQAPASQRTVPEPAAPELLFSEKKLLARLVAQVKALSPSEKALFTWLVEHDGQQVSSQQLADAVGMDVRVTWTDRTKKLLKLPFIQQWGTHQFWFRARLGEYSQRFFASTTDHHAVMQVLVQATR